MATSKTEKHTSEEKRPETGTETEPNVKKV